MIIELIEYKLKEGVDEKMMLTEAKQYHSFFKNKFEGFIDLEVTKGELGWINIMRWENMAEVKACGEVLRTNPQEIYQYGSLIDKSTIKLTFLEQKQYYK